MGVLRWYSRGGDEPQLIEEGTSQAEHVLTGGFTHVDAPKDWEVPEGYEVENPEPEAKPKPSRAKPKA